MNGVVQTRLYKYVLILLSGVLGLGCQGEGSRWQALSPAGCITTSGEPIATISTDSGKTVLRNDRELSDLSGNLVQFAMPSAREELLFATDGGRIFVTENGGCHWEGSYNLEFLANDLVATRENAFLIGSTANLDNYDEVTGEYERIVHLYRVDGELELDQLEAPVPRALATTSDDPTALYLLSEQGEFWRSVDEGETWVQQGAQLLEATDFVINPNDQLHWLATVAGDVHLSFDGGMTWAVADVPVDSTQQLEIRQFAFHDDSSEGIWAVARRQYFDTDGSFVHADDVLLNSVDAGENFQEVVRVESEMPGIGMIATRPGAPGEVYLTEIISLQGGCGRSPGFRLFRYRASDDSLASFVYDRDGAVAGLMFHPEKPDVLYIGNAERPSGCAWPDG